MAKTIIAIETSCDETAVAIIRANTEHITVLSHSILSQAKLHEEFGGVFPNLAKREHAKALPLLIKTTLRESGLLGERGNVVLDESPLKKILKKDDILCEGLMPLLKNIKKPDIDAIAVTAGPGLEPALWVGFNAARALAIAWHVPFYPMNHMEGHIAAALMSPVKEREDEYMITLPPLPALAILISGGHTEFDLMRVIGSYERVGETLDDAVGEAYDKVARLMGLPYPGGPKIAVLAEEARTRNIQPPVSLPRPMLSAKNLSMSFSGLKTAVRYAIEKIAPLTEKNRIGIAREFEDAVRDVLIKKTHAAIEETSTESLIVSGGVSANTYLRNAFGRLANEHGIPLLLPDQHLSTDNALMIAAALALRFTTQSVKPTDPADPNLNVNGTLTLV